MLSWTCIGSGKSGLYTNYYRHRDSCNYCAPALEEEKQQIMKEKKQHFRALNGKQRPWSEWGHSDESCVRHTGLDVEQLFKKATAI
ncbi:unnamed protein product [Rotaria sordida]|uniref:Uncharacterized protein n=1 Tax=Rotaria sordida TaxID=392033 RepID=A0A813NK61_9BILA|nr:unnamed protein product [Rotaria sordida]CAF0812322.1 unnamed protein product [Rotaria sordida]CAF3587841.1 unnamed protein product [Rotaria sordida]CAF4085902.1 unnamed protein product [Rotaria sordida]